MNKSLGTNLISLIVFVGTWVLPEFPGKNVVLSASLFALSGALTNWIAIHMLFEKVPGLYGSGIIELRFEQFKAGIRNLILTNFFTEENFDKMAEEAIPHELPVEKIVDNLDMDQLFEAFLKVVEESSFGGMLSMFGGVQALEPLREPFSKEFQKRLPVFLSHIDFTKLVENTADFKSLRPKIEHMIDLKLEELTPKMVKEIVEQMIREHLGWLVVWGGVFGALIGCFSAFVL